MGEKLKQPTLIEAICEFRFTEQEAWDWTVAGRLFERIQDEFPIRAQLQGIEVRVEQGPNRPPTATFQPGPERVQIRRQDGSALVQIGPHLLTVNHLKPYPSWEDFLDLMMYTWGEYQELGTGATFDRIGLRYINHIPVTVENQEIADYLTVVPSLAASLQVPLRAFYQRYELVESEPVGTLIHQTGILSSPEDDVKLVLDLDFVSQDVGQLQDGNAITQWLNAAHDRIYAAFVDSLNPALYDRLRTGEL